MNRIPLIATLLVVLALGAGCSSGSTHLKTSASQPTVTTVAPSTSTTAAPTPTTTVVTAAPAPKLPPVCDAVGGPAQGKWCRNTNVVTPNSPYGTCNFDDGGNSATPPPYDPTGYCPRPYGKR